MAVAVTFDEAGWGECVIPAMPVPPALAGEVRRVVGAVPEWVPHVAPLPWLVRAICDLIDRPLAHAPLPLCDFVGLVVSQDNSCRYCYGAQRALLKIHGYDDGYVDRLLRDFQMTDVTASERAALAFARRLSRADPLPGPGDVQALVEAGFAPIAAAELVAVVASATFSNRVATLVSLPAESLESFVRHPLFRFVRPFMAWRMRPRRKPPEPAPDPNDGLCAPVVEALAGSPVARVLRRMIDDAWASPVLPRRTKTLMLAVVARALGCVPAEAEATALLADEGFTPPDVAQVLDTLGSPRLDVREARLIPFARETVRYQPAAIQARFRDVCRGFSAEETLETAGVVALANAVCRLSVVIGAR